MRPHALFLNRTLKCSPETSNTQALVDKVAGFMAELGSTTESVRVVDHEVLPGVTSDEGGRDEWPAILDRIKTCHILVIATPIWFGVRSSIAQRVVERLDGTYAEGDPATGRYPLYGKVAGVIVTGNEDGAHDVAANTRSSTSPTWAARSRPTSTATGWATPAPAPATSRQAAPDIDTPTAPRVSAGTRAPGPSKPSRTHRAGRRPRAR